MTIAKALASIVLALFKWVPSILDHFSAKELENIINKRKELEAKVNEGDGDSLNELGK